MVTPLTLIDNFAVFALIFIILKFVGKYILIALLLLLSYINWHWIDWSNRWSGNWSNFSSAPQIIIVVIIAILIFYVEIGKTNNNIYSSLFIIVNLQVIKGNFTLI